MLSRAWLQIHARLVPPTPRRLLLLVVGMAVVVVVARAKAKAKAPTNGMRTVRPRPMPPFTKNADGTPKGRAPSAFAPGSFSSNCTWSAQVLTIKRDVKDKKTGVLKPMPPGIFDVGKFCAANGVAFSDYCWEFVCSYWMSSFDRTNRCFYDMDQRRAAQALGLACARCGHSSDTSAHPEALSAKHALPNHLAKMATYFRQG